MKVINDNEFWDLVDCFENYTKRTKTAACIIIAHAYKRHKSNDLDQAFADVNLLLKGKATIRQYNYLKKNYFNKE